MKRSMFSLAAIAVMAFNSGNVSAEAIGTGQFVGTNSLSGNGTDYSLLYLNGGAASGGADWGIPFVTTVNNQLITISYTSMCGMDNAFFGEYIWIKFKVDSNVWTNPTSGFPICAARGKTVGLANDIGTITATVRVPTAGTHSLTGYGRIMDVNFQPTASWGSLTRSTIVVYK